MTSDRYIKKQMYKNKTKWNKQTATHVHISMIYWINVNFDLLFLSLHWFASFTGWASIARQWDYFSVKKNKRKCNFNFIQQLLFRYLWKNKLTKDIWHHPSNISRHPDLLPITSNNINNPNEANLLMAFARNYCVPANCTHQGSFIQCNVVSHWLSPYPEWSLLISFRVTLLAIVQSYDTSNDSEVAVKNIFQIKSYKSN